MEERQIIRYPGEHDQPHCPAWSPDGRHLAIGDDARPHSTVQVWRAEGGKTDFFLAYHGHRGEVTALSWSPDGERIASASMDGMVHIWDVASGKRRCAYRGHAGEDTWVLAAAWSPDGTRIASAEGGLGEEKQYSIQVWEAATGTHLLTYQGHDAAIYSLAWSPDSRCLLTGSSDGVVQIFTAAGDLLFNHALDEETDRSHTEGAVRVAWSPGEELSALIVLDGTVRVWLVGPLPTQEERPSRASRPQSPA